MVIQAKSFNSASQADMLQPWERADNLDSNGFKKTIDERSFSDFNIDGSEKDWRQEAIEATGSNAYNGKKKGDDKIDNLRDVAEFVQEQQEARQEKQFATMTKRGNTFVFGDYEFEEEDAKTALEEKGIDYFTKDMNEDDSAEFALISQRILDGTATDQDYARAGELSEDFVKAGDAHHDARTSKLEITSVNSTELSEKNNILAEINSEVSNEISNNASKILEMSPEETEQYLQELNELNPELAQEIASQAEAISTEREDTFSLDNQAEDNFALDKPDSVISATFKEEVAAIGANAKSFNLGSNQEFVLDELPTQEKSPEPFTLDA